MEATVPIALIVSWRDQLDLFFQFRQLSYECLQVMYYLLILRSYDIYCVTCITRKEIKLSCSMFKIPGK